ncbi:uncharacterized protein LOC122255024 isoform X2 [Penaeus japonicus]|uniref:uncharacterized protein LOC122255024 isoform X2 n=1 Tax=Penaeus japonicus TaxID=27405 RepID=UPI001C7151C0|nr:uncharacterized protein LOC122255024 isoform X2 [Penaeus japonicus]
MLAESGALFENPSGIFSPISRHGLSIMISTPARRISLRRKRCAGNAGSSDSPVSKRVSPSIEDLDEEAINNSRDGSQVKGSYYVRKLQDSVIPKLPSTPKNNVGSRNEDATVDQQDHHQQHSPDTPFMSSQLCGTQECEVVWDCNSPGYSKDDLKRMPGGDCNDVAMVPSPVTFVAPAPHRMLFPRSRARSQPRSAKDTTAQLDELLNQLSTKGNNSSRPSVQECPIADAQEKIIPYGKLCLPPAGESDLSPSTPPEAAILHQSSQPFEVHDIVKQEELGDFASDTSANVFEDSLWGDDLNMGVCDISDVSEASDSISKQKLNVAKDEKENVLVTNVMKDTTNMSTDVFDDDLFNDSVIRSTQAVEDAMVESHKAEAKSDNFGVESLSSKVQGVGKNVHGKSYVEKRNFVAGIRKTSSVSEDEGVVLSQTAMIGKGMIDRNPTLHNLGDHVQSVNNADALSRYNIGNRANNLSYINRNDKQNLVKKLDDNKRDINENQMPLKNSDSYCDTLNESSRNKAGKTSPIVGKQRKSPVSMAAPQRRVRSSFLLNSTASIQPKGKHSLQESTGGDESSAQFEKYGNRNDNAYSDNQRISSKAGSTIVGTKSDFVGAPLRNTFSSVSNSASLQGTKYWNKEYSIVQAKRPLFKSDSDISDKEKMNDKAQTAKGQFSRSHSTDDAQTKNTKQPSSFRRANSSASVEVSREFEEDDEFFESILCTLPEEEQLYEGNDQDIAPKMSLSKVANLKSGTSLTMNKQNNSQKMANQQEQIRQKAVGPVNALGMTKTLHDATRQGDSGNRNVKDASFRPISKPQQNVRKDSRGAQFNFSSAKEKNTYQDEVQPVAKSSNAMQDDFGADDFLDDDFFEDDVLTFIEEVESQYSSQQSHGEASNSQPSVSQQMKCTQDEIARKKEAAQRLREEKQRQRHKSGHYRPVC